MAVFGWPDLRKLNRVTEERGGTAASGKNARGLRPHDQVTGDRDHSEVNTEILLPEYRAEDPRS